MFVRGAVTAVAVPVRVTWAWRPCVWSYDVLAALVCRRCRAAGTRVVVLLVVPLGQQRAAAAWWRVLARREPRLLRRLVQTVALRHRYLCLHSVLQHITGT